MLRKRLLIFLVALYAGMGYSHYRTFHYIDPSLQRYNSFYLKYIHDICPSIDVFYPRQTIIQFGSLDDPTIGLCASGRTRFKIVIDKEYWKQASLDEKMALAFHEMGHCYLGLNHSMDKSNYMYESTPQYLTIADILQQTAADVQNLCPKK